ncbi:putative fluoride ion transporter CrcB [Flavobacteriaceae bacterium UJ101]|nr:putative fluoride ion transporter CrcB [Flavobacteriaceae bacterium UJ101]
MKDLLLIFVGGGLGSILRFWAGKELNTNFPYGTLFVNVLGAFIIGIILALFEKEIISNSSRLLLAVGFCGGFTTWSSFAFEKFHMLREGHITHFIMYIGMSILFSLIAVLFSYKIIKFFI